ncbi:MAG: RagB/SusD family nutrient uptake outer membrane protein [Bacteroides nordii]|jgi:putative lipoprotein
MKKKILYIALALISLSSCNDSFLDRLPETSLVTENFFRSPSDLALFVNKLYLSESPKYWDPGTDNVVASEKDEILDLIRGNITPETVGGWYWGQIRELNYFLDNAGKAQGSQELINHYIGIVRMLRGLEYYERIVKRYSDGPWYEHVLKDTDTELLMKTQDTRTFIVDKIMEDLEFGVQNILLDIKDRTVYNKWYAYGLLARIALHEGTFRKYHDELELQSSADQFLEKAVNACEKIMANTTDFGIYTDGGIDAYGNMFISNNLSKCKEILLFKDFSYDLNIKHDVAMNVFSYNTDLSRSLMESYLIKKDGKAVPFSSIDNYKTKTFMETFEDRDPRYRQTFMYPGYIRPGDAKPFIPNLNLGGYTQIKFVPQDPQQNQWGCSYNDLPLMRLGEILLIYAEAKAELGTLTQADLDKSINQLRDRVGMPHMVLSELTIDPTLEQQYPNVNGNLKNAILEIRRERRVELACEGFRKDDILRWKVGKLLEMPQGVYIAELNTVFDVTGDGVTDVGVFLNKESVKPIYKKKVLYYLEEQGEKTSISLSEGDHGYIILTNDITNPKKFIEPKYYYYPIPKNQFTYNPNLRQTIFWDK